MTAEFINSFFFRASSSTLKLFKRSITAYAESKDLNYLIRSSKCVSSLSSWLNEPTPTLAYSPIVLMVTLPSNIELCFTLQSPAAIFSFSIIKFRLLVTLQEFLFSIFPLAYWTDSKRYFSPCLTIKIVSSKSATKYANSSFELISTR